MPSSAAAPSRSKRAASTRLLGEAAAPAAAGRAASAASVRRRRPYRWGFRRALSSAAGASASRALSVAPAAAAWRASSAASADASLGFDGIATQSSAMAHGSALALPAAPPALPPALAAASCCMTIFIALACEQPRLARTIETRWWKGSTIVSPSFLCASSVPPAVATAGRNRVHTLTLNVSSSCCFLAAAEDSRACSRCANAAISVGSALRRSLSAAGAAAGVAASSASLAIHMPRRRHMLFTKCDFQPSADGQRPTGM